MLEPDVETLPCDAQLAADDARVELVPSGSLQRSQYKSTLVEH